MPTRLLKLSASQSLPYDKNNDRFSFDINQLDGSVDLASSYMVLNVNAEAQNRDGVPCLPRLYIGMDRTTPSVNLNNIDLNNPQLSAMTNSSMFKNVKLTSQRQGIIEEIQDCNLLVNNIQRFLRDKDLAQEQNLKSVSYLESRNDSTTVNGLYSSSLWRPGPALTDTPTYTNDLLVPLHDLGLGTCQNSDYSMSQSGNMTLHLELEEAANYIKELNGQYTVPLTTGNNEFPNNLNAGSNLTALVSKDNYADATKFYPGQGIFIHGAAAGTIIPVLDISTTIKSCSIGDAGALTIYLDKALGNPANQTGWQIATAPNPDDEFPDIRNAAGSLASLNSKDDLLTDSFNQRNLFWIGESITVKSAGGTWNRVISNIEAGTNTNDYKVTFNLPLNNNANDTDWVILHNPIQRTPIDDVRISIFKAELVLVQRSKIPKQLSVPFSTWTVDRINLTYASVSWNHLFDIEPSVFNVFLMSPISTGDEPLMSEVDNVNDIRLSLNNKFLTNRSYAPLSSIYNDRTMMTFMNMGKSVRNLESFEKRFMVICQPIPMSDKYQQLQVQLKASANMTPKVFYLFKQVLKTQ